MSSTEPQQDAPAWRITEQHGAIDDPLLGCLVILTQYYNRPYSADALAAGLPLVNHRFTPELFIRAAERVKFSAKIVKRSINKLSELVLPAVLLLHDQQALIVTQLDFEHAQATCIQPESGVGERRMALHKLQEKYTGYSLFMQPQFTFSQTADDTMLHAKTRHWFWSAIFRSWRIYRDVLLASMMINIFALASPLFVMNVYDRVVPNHAIETLWVLATGAAIVFGFDVLMRFLRGYFIDLAGKKTDVLLSSMIFEKVMGLKMLARPPSVGAFANNLKAFESVRDFITSATITTVIDLPFVVLFLLMMHFIGGPLVWIPLVGMPIILLYALLVKIPLENAVARTFTASAEKNGLLIEALVAMETIKAATAEGVMQRKWELNNSFIAQHGLTARLLSSSVVNIATFSQQLCMIGVVVSGVYLIADGELTMGALIATVILMGRAMAPMGQVANLLAQYQQTQTALHALNQIMQLPVEKPPGQSFTHRDHTHGSISFDQVSFHYPTQQQLVLDQVSLHINAGERVAIIGRIGSGKTTIEKLVLGLYEPTSGAVLIDGVDIRQLDPSDVRRSIGYVPQDSALFQGSVKDNIVLGAPFVDDATILRAAKIAGLDAFINQHPAGFDLPVGERGEQLSGGQRQMVVIARAALLDPPIYLLDEPTNEMDNLSEEHVKKQLTDVLPNKTLLMVTHRASMLKLVDRIIVLENGKIIADGAKEEVLSALKEGKVQMRSTP